MPLTAKLASNVKITAAGAFVRSLNILLKFARLYGFEHARTTAQFETAWGELRAAVPADNEAGLLLGATGSQLLVDGVPLAATPAERSFARLLTAAGLASIHFSPGMTQDDLARFVRAFPAGTAKPTSLAEQLKTALAGASGIRINEIRFVAEDSSLVDAKMAAEITVRTLGAEAEQFKAWLNDPQKLLQLIAAAEGARGSLGGGGQGSGQGAGQAGATQGQALGGRDTSRAGFAPQEEDIFGIMRLLTRLGQLSHQPGAPVDPSMFQEQLTKLPGRAQETLRQAVASLAAQATTDRPDDSVLLKLAEHLAIRFALERYARGEVRVDAVRQMLDRMNQEIEGLRKVLGAHEEKMARAGLLVESHADILDRQFWAEAPESAKRTVLLSPDAWCIPPRNVRQYVEELLRCGEFQAAHGILLNYASCGTRSDAEVRRKTAIGLGEFAELYASTDGRVLTAALRQVGLQLSAERDAELQSLVSAAFVRLSQEAATRRFYPAMQQALASLDRLEQQRPAFAQSLRPRIGVENRLPEFIEEVLRTERIPDGLADVLRLVPRPAIEQLTARFSRCGYREDCDRLIELARELGPDGVCCLRERLRTGSAAEAAETVGLLSRLDAGALEQWLPTRLRECQPSAQDRVVRQLAGGGAPERGRLLVAVFDELNPLIMPLALDEIGMSGDTSAVARLVRLADGELPQAGRPYLRLKAIEALGRLRATKAIPVLRSLLEAKQLWRWAHPSELRILAAQALEKIDPEWAQNFLPRSGLNAADLSLAPLDPVPDSPWIRQRRHPRIRLPRPLAAVTTNLRNNCRLEIKVMNLGGGVAICERQFSPGTLIGLKLNPGLRPVRAQALVRDARAQAVSFEMVDIDLEEHARLRRLLVGAGGVSVDASPSTRTRRRGRGPVATG